MNLPIRPKLIDSVQAMINRFFWRAKPPRIRAKVTYEKIQNGGLVVPNHRIIER